MRRVPLGRSRPLWQMWLLPGLPEGRVWRRTAAAAGFGIAAWHDGGKADPYAIIVLRSNGPKATAALLFT